MPVRPVRRARGVALLIVLVVLVLIATLATEIAISAKTSYRMADHAMEDLLLRTAVDSRVEVLKCALRYDGTNGSGYDGEADDWSWHNHEKLSSWGERASSTSGSVTGDEAGLTASFKNTDVEITAWCEDERSKVNLRGLMKPEDSPVFQNTRDLLVRVIDLYREQNSSLDLTDGDAKEMVDDLVKWLQAEADTEDNPMPAVKPNRGRLQSVDDLVRVPGGHWTPERLYDVKDPNVDEEEAAPEPASGPGEDPTWGRVNGIPGLARYLTVFAEDSADPAMRVNVNTAPLVVMKALFDANDEDIAEELITHRREGAEDASTTGSTPGTSTGGTGGTSNDPAKGFFKSKQDLTKVDAFGQDVAKYPRLNFFADVSSPVYSIRVIAKVVRKTGDDVDTGTTEDGAPRQVDAIYDYRAVVQRTAAGFLTLYTERRSDPIYDR